jgi:hypothetical protein
MKERRRQDNEDCALPLEDEVTALWFKETVCVTEGTNIVYRPHGKHMYKINGFSPGKFVRETSRRLDT